MRPRDLGVKLRVIETRECGVAAVCGKDDAIQACPAGGGEAHRARFAARVEDAAREAEGLYRRRRRTDRDDLGVRGRVVDTRHAIPTTADDLRPAHDDRTERTAGLFPHVLRGEGHREAHEFGVLIISWRGHARMLTVGVHRSIK